MSSKIKAKATNENTTVAVNKVKNFFARLFHTILIAAASYFTILLGTISVPTILAYILGGLGFGGSEAQSGSVFIVSMMAGFFLTAWIFVGSYMLLKALAKIYVRNIRRTLSDKTNARIDELFAKKKNS